MKNFSQWILNSKELYAALIRILTIIKSNIPTDVFITKVEPLLKAVLGNLNIALGRLSNSTYVKLLETKDGVRDTCFISLRNYCNGFLLDKDPVIANAAAVIVNIFKQLGWSLYSQGYAVETTSLELLFTHLDAEPAKSALTTLSADSRYADLKTAQTDFEVTFKSKVSTEAREVYPKIRECRIEIARYSQAILNYIDIMAEIEGNGYTTSATQIDEVIAEAEAIARARDTRNSTETTPAA